MRFETFVALRYLRGKRKNRFISLITIISIAGVSVGVMTLIIVMSVMTGFNEALRDTIIGNRAHFVVVDNLGYTVPDYRQLIREVMHVVPEVEAAAPFIQIYSLLENRGGRKIGKVIQPALVVGIEPAQESEVTQFLENLSGEEGRRYGAGAPPGFKEIVLGYVLADNLGVGIGDRVALLTLRENVKPTPFGGQQSTQIVMTVSGIAQAKMSEFDTVYAWVNLETARIISGREGVDGIQCRIEDPFKAQTYASEIEQNLPYNVVTWYENQLAFFEALRQEKLAMFIILVFIVLVAAFNITSTLIMMVMEKERDIGILRTIGVSGQAVLRLFMIEGLIIGLTGTFFGVLLGIILAYNLNPVAEFLAAIFQIDLFNQQIYYFDRIPVEVVPRDVAWITVCAIILSFISTFYPAWSASRLNPVDALRYE